MTVEGNIRLIHQFYDCVLNRDWRELEKLIHEDYGEGISIQNLIKETNLKTEEDVIKYFGINNPFIKFLRLVGISEDITGVPHEKASMMVIPKVSYKIDVKMSAFAFFIFSITIVLF